MIDSMENNNSSSKAFEHLNSQNTEPQVSIFRLLSSFVLMGLLVVFCFSLLFCAQSIYAVDNQDVKTSHSKNNLYTEQCSKCHGLNREGGMGPALLPENLERLGKKTAFDVIKNGRVATQMPLFSQLSDEQIQALVDVIYTRPDPMPSWTEQDIQKSQKLLNTEHKFQKSPIFKADPWNLFIVVEAGDHHATILDGDKFEPITRFPTHFALHGGPKFTEDGRYVYFASRDGWISKYDIYNLTFVAEVRAGINTRNIAVSDDGRYVAVANYWPLNLVILDGRDLRLQKIIPAVSQTGIPSRVSAVYDARSRHSFVVALKDVPELWELPYDKNASAEIKGMVHDYRPDSGDDLNQKSGQFVAKVTELDAILDDFFFSPDYRNVMGAVRPLGSGKKSSEHKDGLNQPARGQVVQLDVKRKIADLDLPGMPHLGSGISWMYQGHRIMATPNLGKGEISFINMDNWKTFKTINTEGPGFFMRSHENTPYAWTDVFFGPNKDKVHIIDKRTLEIVKTLQPVPGKTAAHVEFTKDGRYALLSILEDDGMLIVYDAKTFEEVKRLPMSHPVGKYNIYNKAHLSTGTSH